MTIVWIGKQWSSWVSLEVMSYALIFSLEFNCSGSVAPTVLKWIGKTVNLINTQFFSPVSFFPLLNSDKRWWGGMWSELSDFFFSALSGPLCHLNWCNLYHSSGSAITLSIAVDSISLSFKWIQLDSSSQANSTNDAIPHAASPKEISSLKSGPFISWYKQDTYKPTLLFGHFDSPAILEGGRQATFL